MSVAVGFSKVNLMDILPENKHCEMPILGIGLFLEQQGKRSFFFTVDFMDFDLTTVSTLSTAISKELSNTQIHIVTTHNHGGESCSNLNMEKFCNHAQACAKAAFTNAKVAKIRIASGEISEQVTFKRRILVPQIDSTFTCFYGIDTMAKGNASNFVDRALEQLENNALCFTGTGTTNPNGNLTFKKADQNLSVIEFRTLDDLPIGNIIRFASHAVCCNMSNCYSSDYPGYLRTNMEKALGGISLFFNGPCAEIAPVIPGKSVEAGKKLADILTKNALALLENSSFYNLEHFSDKVWPITLPVREELINKNVKIAKLPEEISDLKNKKAILEQQRVKAIMPFLMGIHQNGEKNYSNNITVSNALLELNNWNLLFFSGETFSSTAKEITSKFPDKKWITVTEHGRTAMYIPPNEEYRNGGYEPTCATVSIDGENALKKQLIELLEKC